MRGVFLSAARRRRRAVTRCSGTASPSVVPEVWSCPHLRVGPRTESASRGWPDVCRPGAAWFEAGQGEWHSEEDRTRPRRGVVDHFRRGGISRPSSRHGQLLPPPRANAGARSDRRPHTYVAPCPNHRMARLSPSAGRWRPTDYERWIARWLRSMTVMSKGVLS
jgi:hypothetical protein